MTNFCSKCRAALRSESLFCTKCGRRQDSKAPSSIPPRPTQTESSHAAPIPSVKESRRNRPKPQPKSIRIALSVLVILVLVIFWPFIQAFGRGLFGLPLSGTVPRPSPPTASPLGTPSSNVVSPNVVSPVAQPSPLQTADNPPEETYILPHTDKTSPFVDNEYVDDMKRAAEAMNNHTDMSRPLTKRQDWELEAGILWSGVLMLQEKARTASPDQRHVYEKRAQDLAHLCHLVRSEPDDPSLQHYRVRIIYSRDGQAK